LTGKDLYSLFVAFLIFYTLKRMMDSGNSTANSINDWLESQIHQQVAIWCEDPETNIEKYAGGFVEKSYLTYRILYKQIGRDLIAVRHRYSEFESLRTDLRDRYHPMGILVPSLPPKGNLMNVKSSTQIDQSFVKERTLGLTLFCEVRKPFSLVFPFSHPFSSFHSLLSLLAV
jgi:hypothetical protein